MSDITEAHEALDRLGVPRAECDPDGDDRRVFSLAERIKGFWPYPSIELACGHTVQGDPAKPVRCSMCVGSREKP